MKCNSLLAGKRWSSYVVIQVQFLWLSSVICTKHWYTQHNAAWYWHIAGNGLWFNINWVGRYSSNIFSFQIIIIPHISMIHGTDKNHHCGHYKGIWRSGGTAPCILNLGIRWRWVVRFIPCLLYPCGFYWTGGWIGPTASMHVLGNKLCPCQEWRIPYFSSQKPNRYTN